MDKLKLLYVDDEVVNLTNFNMAMKHHFHVLTADSARTALDCFKKHSDIALVVADQRMPGMSGADLLAEIRTLYPDTVRLMLTAYSDPADIMAAINKGEIYHYLTKPWQEDLLLDILNKAAEKYRLTQDNRSLLEQLRHKNEQLQKELQNSRRLKDSLVRRDLILGAVSDTAQKIISSSRWRDFTEPLLARLGLAMAASKVNIYSCHQDAFEQKSALLEFEWCSESIDTTAIPPFEKVFNFSADHLQRWLAIFQKGEAIITNRDALPGHEAAHLKEHHIESLICLPMMVHKRCWGLLVITDCTRQRTWPDLEISAAKSAASLIGEAVYRDEMNEELIAKQEQLAYAGRLTAIGEMARGLSHEINLPMSHINLGADQLQQYLSRNKEDAPQAAIAKEMSSQVAKVMQLLEHMRIFSTPSKDKTNDTNLYWTINDALTFFREQFRMALIELHEETSEAVPYITTNNLEVEQIIINLLANARYAVSKKNEAIKNFPMQVWVRLFDKEPETEDTQKLGLARGGDDLTAVVIIEVEDNGIGMSEETRQHCTDPFFTTKPTGEGTGLGLSITASLIKKLGYHLEIQSTLGEGSLFRITIPTYQKYPVLLANNEVRC